MKEPDSLQQVGRTFVLFKKRKFSYFAGCDYFRLSSHPEIMRAVRTGLEKYGLNVAASRVTTGNHALYRELEAALARFFGAPAALLVSNGYATNSIVAQTLRDDFSHVVIDAKAHVSLLDAGRLFSGRVLKFKNRDPADFHRVLARAGRNSRPILLTDGVFTPESEVAPVREYLKILKTHGPHGRILLDDAHGAGVIGRRGRGTLEHEEVSRERIIQTVTLSKAFGVYGGAILCSRMLRERMFVGSATFAGSTPLPLPLANAAMRATQLLSGDRSYLKRLHHNTEYVKTALRAAGLPVPLTPVPVIAIKPGNATQAAAIRRSLMSRGIYPSFNRYPGGPVGGYFRFVISSEHSRKQLDDLLEGIAGSWTAANHSVSPLHLVNAR
jgi:7-keto-8-aminopelargonate synthetase-like enzyme